jgi:hypothetical protein
VRCGAKTTAASHEVRLPIRGVAGQFLVGAYCQAFSYIWCAPSPPYTAG